MRRTGLRRQVASLAPVPALALPWLVMVLVLCLSPGCVDATLCQPDDPYVDSVLARSPVLGNVTPTSAVVAWDTHQRTRGALEWRGPDGEPVAVDASASAQRHVVTLEGLAPATRYEYAVLVDGESVGGRYSFVTAPASADAPVRFAVVGDTGSGCGTQRAIADRIRTLAPELLLHTGDLAYRKGTRQQLHLRHFIPYAEVLSRIPLYPTIGNHDFATEQGAPMLESHELPRNDETGTEHFYAFTWGDIRFFALNSNAPLHEGSPQHRWLSRELGNATQTWKVVLLHHPPYNARYRRGDPDVRTHLEPLFDRHRVDLVFAGHDHNYQRTYPIRAGKPVTDETETYEDPQGTIYVVTGGGGREVNDVSPTSHHVTALPVNHLVQVDIQGRELVLSVFDADGEELDRLTLSKSPPA